MIGIARLKIFTLAAVLVWSVVQQVALAGQVNWGSTRFATNLQSNGSPLSGGHTFELGGFEEGFQPTSENVSEWEQRWIPIQSATYSTKHRFFAASALIKGGTIPEQVGGQGYIWGFDTKSNGGEWVLMTNADWSWPSADGLANPVDWLASAASAIVGTVTKRGATHIVTERVEIGSGGSFASEWIAKNFPGSRGNAAISGWDADPDGDGVANLVEMALGSDPLSGAQSNLPIPGEIAIGGKTYLTLTIQKAAGDAVDYSVETSGDLKDWIAGDAVVLEETADRIVVRDSRATSVTVGNRQVRLRLSRFLRLAVHLKN